MKKVGVVSRGICTPIIKQGMDLEKVVADSILEAASSEEGGFTLRDRDVVGVTESVVARSQGNYATLEQVAEDIKAKLNLPESGSVIGVTLPILSRNRFSHILRGISLAAEKLYIMLAYPSDEVGNPLINMDVLDEKGVNPYTDVFTADEFTKLFGKPSHPFTGIDYIEYYKEITDGKAEIILANEPCEILKYTKNVIAADIHTRHRSKRRLKSAGANVITLDEVLNASKNGSGWHPDYGVLGSNLATDNTIKLFPRDAQAFAEGLGARLYKESGKKIEVLVYGDGAFKDPVGGIWELADPVVSPGFTKGLEGTPNELKIKYLADNVSSEESDIQELIKSKKADLVGDMSSQGTTPRRFSDLLGSLCDLTSGSGDKGTPVVLVQGYFDSYAD
ncbi:MAG: coenzyme F420-0:L-glutamate ligase [Oscillospiraceae bacterium]|nr:coenzyme F420-0:L-glutamate ligase [Oscillospiraceae bacterium]